MFWNIAGWVIWGFFSLLSVGLVLSANRDGGVRFMMRTQGLVLAIGLVATVAFSVSKFHLLWVFPVAVVTPMVIMHIRVANAMKEAHSMIVEARVRDDNSEAESLESMKVKLARAKRDLELLENPDTIFAFGQMSYDGDGVEQNYTEAASWFRIAAELGHAKAAHNLGLMYEEGKGVAQDLTEAVKWYEFGATAGNASSQNNLGTLLETGQGIRLNSSTPKGKQQWLIARRGFPCESERLGTMVKGETSFISP